MADIPLGGVSSVSMLAYLGKRVHLSGDDDQVHMIRHQPATQNGQIMPRSVIPQQIEVNVPLGVGGQDELTGVGTLRNVVRYINADHSGETSHVKKVPKCTEFAKRVQKST